MSQFWGYQAGDALVLSAHIRNDQKPMMLRLHWQGHLAPEQLFASFDRHRPKSLTADFGAVRFQLLDRRGIEALHGMPRTRGERPCLFRMFTDNATGFSLASRVNSQRSHKDDHLTVIVKADDLAQIEDGLSTLIHATRIEPLKREKVKAAVACLTHHLQNMPG